jgi:hypothetical protein
MRTTLSIAFSALALAGCGMLGGGHHEGPLKVISDRTVGGFVFPESVGCDAAERVLYVSQFGGKELKPAEKDALGYVSKVSLDGKVIEQRAFAEVMNKPKGIWIAGSRLWVTDIDGVWVFDTKSKRGRKLALPGIQFANDPAVRGNVLYVSDNRSDQLFRIEPAGFLSEKPRIVTRLAKQDINPNGLYPGRDGSLLMVGFLAPDKPRGIHAIARGRDGALRTLAPPTGRLDGLYQMRDGSLLLTDWNNGSLSHWSAEGGMRVLAKGFQGPADFCVLGDTVYVPDLVKSEVRMIRLAR